MTANTKVKLYAKFTLFGLLLILIIVLKKHTQQKNDRKKSVVTRQVKADDTLDTNTNLYFYKHPYLLKADRFNDERKYDSAIYFYKEAAAKFESEQQWQSYVWVNSYIGRLYLRILGKNYKDAFPFLQKAFEKGSQKLNRKNAYLAITVYYLGIYYYKKKNADSSLKAYNRALELLIFNFKEANVHISDVHEALGDLYAEAYFNHLVAENHYLKSLDIKEKLPSALKDSVLTNSYYKMVSFYILSGDFEKAQTFCYKAIQYLPYVKYHRLHWEELLEGVLADIYQEQHLYQKAIFTLKKAISINNENKDGDKGYLSFYYHSLGDVYDKSLHNDSAIFFYKKSLKLTHDASLFEDQTQRNSDINYSLGMIFLRLKSYNTALMHLRRCLTLRLNIYGRKNPETAVIFQGIGNAYLEMGVKDSALKYIQEGVTACTRKFNDTAIYSVPLASDLNTGFYSYQIVKDKALILKQLYNDHPVNIKTLHASMAYYCLADTLIILFGAGYDREEAKLLFAKNNSSIYEEAIDCAAELFRKTSDVKYLDLVFTFMDRRKSGLLTGALDETAALKQSYISVDDQNIIRQLQQERTFLQSQLEKATGEEDMDDQVLKALHNRTYEVETKIKAFKRKLYSRYPYYATLQRATDTVGLKDLVSFSCSNNSLVLQYFWGEKALYALGVYKGKSHLIKIEKNTGLEANVNTLKACLTKGYISAGRNSDFASFQNSSFNVYCSLVKPMLDTLLLPSGETQHKPGIIVIPDGLISDMPFEALITSTKIDKDADYRKLNYLIKSFTISYNSSARLLLKKNLQQAAGHQCKVLGLSYSKDSVVKNQSGNLHALRNLTADDLPGSAEELKSISLYMNGKFYMGNEATEGVFKKEAPNYEILHLALHGKADSQYSYGSRLIFKKGNDSLNDESLYAYEIYNIPIKAKLAVLSACESGTGKLNPGEGIFSMARGFIYAGCPAVVMSFWKVNDNLTALIMRDFYKHLSVGVSIDQSLRKAKLEYIERADGRSAHPAYWSAFVAMGKMDPVINNTLNYMIIIRIAIILLIGITGYFITKKFIGKRQL